MYRCLITNRRWIRWAAVLTFALVIFAAPTTTVHAADFIPELDIPGQFSGPQDLDSNLFGRYVRAIYVYFIWIVGIIATTMIIFAGVKWVAAAGDQGRIRDARDMINNAIIGVIIALTSVVMLNLLSPRFTTLSIPGAKVVKGTPFVKNPVTGCIDNLACPTDMSRTFAIYCAGSSFGAAGGGTALYVDADVPFCANNGSHRGICCRNTTTNQCTGISAASGDQLSGECFANAAKIIKETTTASCTNATACGQKVDLPDNRQCIGTFCPAGQVCADTNGSKNARCIDPTIETNNLLRTEISVDGVCSLPGGGKRFYQYYTSSAACGTTITVYDPELKTQAQAAGTNGGCASGQYCGTAPIGAVNGECAIVAPRTICKSTTDYPR